VGCASSSFTSSTSCRRSSRRPASGARLVDGIKQTPIEGTSFAYTFDAKNAKAPSRHKTQYFEMMGQWALYNDGWFLSTKVNRAPWEAFGPANPDPLNNQVLELFNLNSDFNQTTDVARRIPQKGEGAEADVRRGGAQASGLPDGRVGRRAASSRRGRTSPPGRPSSSTRGR
jgi:arylsulfatase A-like enzyme